MLSIVLQFADSRLRSLQPRGKLVPLLRSFTLGRDIIVVLVHLRFAGGQGVNM